MRPEKQEALRMYDTLIAERVAELTVERRLAERFPDGVPWPSKFVCSGMSHCCVKYNGVTEETALEALRELDAVQIIKEWFGKESLLGAGLLEMVWHAMGSPPVWFVPEPGRNRHDTMVEKAGAAIYIVTPSWHPTSGFITRMGASVVIRGWTYKLGIENCGKPVLVRVDATLSADRSWEYKRVKDGMFELHTPAHLRGASIVRYGNPGPEWTRTTVLYWAGQGRMRQGEWVNG